MRTRGPLVTAHSGCEGTPENSLESMIAGAEAEADTIEIDVRSTSNGTAVLMHDEWESATKEPSTSLDDALKLAVRLGIALNLDLKDNRCIEPTIALVRRYGLEDRVIITGCAEERAAAVRAAAPELPVLLNVSAPQSRMTDGEYAEFARRVTRAATEHNCCGINIQYEACREELVRHARFRYLPVSVWTVDEESSMSKMVEMGVDSITTYHPRRLSRLLGRSG